jgi:hypothetical protein
MHARAQASFRIGSLKPEARQSWIAVFYLAGSFLTSETDALIRLLLNSTSARTFFSSLLV